MLRLFKRGKIYHVRGTVGGKRLRKSTKTSDRLAAEKLRHKWETELREGGDDSHFADAVVEYEKYGGDETYLRLILDYFWNKRLREFNTKMVHAAAIELKPNCKNATRNRHVVVPVRAVLNHAADIGMFKGVRIKSLKEDSPLIPHATLGWFQKFFAVAPENLSACVLTMAKTGLRVSNAVALERKHDVGSYYYIDLSNSKAYCGRTKNGEPIVVHLPQDVVVAIANLPEYENGRVFGYTSRMSVNSAIAKACKKAKIPILSPHRCGRHTFAHFYMECCGDVKELMQAGGWKSLNAVKKYLHLKPTAASKKTDNMPDLRKAK